jgi:Transposase
MVVNSYTIPLDVTQPRPAQRPPARTRRRPHFGLPRDTALAALVRSFAVLLTPADANTERLTTWIAEARDETLPHLHAFTRGLEQDRAAVNAALTYPYHNGGTEGVNTKSIMWNQNLRRILGESSSGDHLVAAKRSAKRSLALKSMGPD